MTATPNTKPYWEMTTAELREATREFDRERPGVPGRPLNREERQLHRQVAKRARMGRPRIGLGAKRVLISIERALLDQADRYARQQRISRSQLFAQGVRWVLAKAG